MNVAVMKRVSKIDTMYATVQKTRRAKEAHFL
jgi:hypothetical protein